MSQAALRGDGRSIRYTNGTGGALTVGNIISVGELLGLLLDAGEGSSGPNTTLADGSTGDVAIDGIVEVAKVGGAGGAVVAGQKAFWDAGNSRMTPLADGNRYAGVFAENATEAATRCLVKLNVPSDASIASVPMLFTKKAAAASGSNAFFTAPRALRLIDWWIISRTTGAANVKLVNAGTDMTAVVAKGTTDDAIVRGSTIVEAQEVVAKDAAVTINISAAEEVDVFALFEPQ